MNERFRELAEQAGVQIVKPTNYATALAEQGQLKNLEKFAELIIKETLQVARAGIEFGNGMEDAVYKYFGVEK